jgi:hypothetical protein
MNDAVGKSLISYRDDPEDAYKEIHKVLCKEYGMLSLSNQDGYSARLNVLNFFHQTQDIEKALDVIELTFNFIGDYIKENYQFYTQKVKIDIEPDDAINELNERFKEHAIGYRYEQGEIIKIDSTYVHSEIVKPTLQLLQNKKFRGANDEYLISHEHYRHGRNKECLTECLKAFESSMKIICKEKGWAFNQTDTAKKLIQICFSNNLIPSYVQNQFTSLQNLLESGIPTLRNKLGGHGQGPIPQKVDDDITRYGLNLTGTNIIFLIELSGIK